MTGNIEATDIDLFAQVMDYANRADPYPLYARLRETPVVRADDGLYLVSTYDEIRSLLFHPKVSSNVVQRLRFPRTGNPFADWITNPIKERLAHRYRCIAPCCYAIHPNTTACAGILCANSPRNGCKG
jgi:hypothetical protein